MSSEELREYRAFRTGLTYQDIYRMLWVNSDDPKQWRYKRRGSVLRLWRQLKLDMWAEKCRREDATAMPANDNSQEEIDDPFDHTEEKSA